MKVAIGCGYNRKVIKMDSTDMKLMMLAKDIIWVKNVIRVLMVHSLTNHWCGQHSEKDVSTSIIITIKNVYICPF